MDAPEIEEVLSHLAEKRYSDYAAQVAAQIRSLADEFEQAAHPYPNEGVMGIPRFTAAADAAMHRILWGVANLNADGLISRAVLADQAEREVSLAGESPPPRPG